MVMTASDTERLMTVEEFDAWVLLPENSGRDSEYVGVG